MALAEEIRHLSHDLHPGLLQHAGLVTALSVFCTQFQKLHAIAVTYSADADIGHSRPIRRCACIASRRRHSVTWPSMPTPAMSA